MNKQDVIDALINFITVFLTTVSGLFWCLEFIMTKQGGDLVVAFMIFIAGALIYWYIVCRQNENRWQSNVKKHREKYTKGYEDGFFQGKQGKGIIK